MLYHLSMRMLTANLVAAERAPLPLNSRVRDILARANCLPRGWVSRLACLAHMPLLESVRRSPADLDSGISEMSSKNDEQRPLKAMEG